MKGYIYKYSYPNGKVYIGQTSTSLEQRNKEHVWASKDKNRAALCELAIAKYGIDNIKIDILETIDVDDTAPTLLTNKLNEAEKKWIDYYNSTDTMKGYNIMLGGERKTPDKYILEEKWYEVWKKDGYATFIPWVEETLKNIGKKICSTKEKLTKEEKSLWYGTPFRIISIDTIYGKSTFHGIYKKVMLDKQTIVLKEVSALKKERAKSSPLYSLVTVGLVEAPYILQSKDIQIPHTDDNKNKPYNVPMSLIDVGDLEFDDTDSIKETEENFNIIMEQAIQYMVEDIRQHIWEKIMKKKDIIISNWYKK